MPARGSDASRLVPGAGRNPDAVRVAGQVSRPPPPPFISARHPLLSLSGIASRHFLTYMMNANLNV